MRRTLLLAALATCCVVVFSSQVAFAADNWLGTWKLNVAKSKYSPGPAPKGRTVKIESTADGITLTSDGMTSDGSAAHAAYTSKFDGAQVPWAGNPDADTSTAKRVDDNNFENTWMKDGKATIHSNAAVSKDGKTLTISQTGMNAKGQKVKNKEVYDRQ
jgi:hypothetical protein